MLKKVLLGSLGAVLVLTAGILLGHFGIQRGSTTPDWVVDVTQDVDEALIQKFIAEVDNIAIQENLRSDAGYQSINCSIRSHAAGYCTSVFRFPFFNR